MQLDHILPRFCCICRMSKNFTKMSSEICTLTYHAMLNCDNHTISRYELVCGDPSCLSESYSSDDRALAESAEKGA